MEIEATPPVGAKRRYEEVEDEDELSASQSKKTKPGANGVENSGGTKVKKGVSAEDLQPSKKARLSSTVSSSLQARSQDW